MGWKKGKSGNPKGRPALIPPELRGLLDGGKLSVKALIHERLRDTNCDEFIKRIIDQGIAEGDVQRFKILLEMAYGKMVDEPTDFPITEEEKQVILRYREWKLNGTNQKIPGTTS